VCGDVVVWKPSGKVPLCAVMVMELLGEVLKENGVPEGVFSLVVGGGKSVGEALLRDPRVSLVSFTGSTGVGRHVSQTVAPRFGRTILELAATTRCRRPLRGHGLGCRASCSARRAPTGSAAPPSAG
jgi:aldehyde dehydrogenase (NAD+)